jgi:hypothetical protein
MSKKSVMQHVNTSTAAMLLFIIRFLLLFFLFTGTLPALMRSTPQQRLEILNYSLTHSLTHSRRKMTLSSIRALLQRASSRSVDASLDEAFEIIQDLCLLAMTGNHVAAQGIRYKLSLLTPTPIC